MADLIVISLYFFSPSISVLTAIKKYLSCFMRFMKYEIKMYCVNNVQEM